MTPAAPARTLERVLVTGIGAVTPIGNDAPSFLDGLRGGRNGIGRVTRCQPDDLPVRIAGEVEGFDPERHLDRRTARRTARFAQFAVAAGREALEDAGLAADGLQDDIGVVMATSGDAFEMGVPYLEMERRGPMKADPFIITRSGQHMGAARVARELGLRGPNTTINTACASGTDALGHALNLIRLGQAEALLAGGSEAIIGRLALASMGRLGALSRNNDDPERACRPFDRDRDGFVPRRGRRRAAARVRTLRPRPRRPRLRRAGRCRLVLRRHRRHRPRPRGRGSRHAPRPRRRRHRPRRGGLRQRPRHQHALQRPQRDPGRQARPRRGPRPPRPPSPPPSP